MFLYLSFQIYIITFKNALPNNIILAPKSTNQISRSFSKTKDPIPFLKTHNQIYEISCNGNGLLPCDNKYIGKTTSLKQCINSHRCMFKRGLNQSSLFNHAIV